MPELILFNAMIVTMDPLMPRAEALSVSNGRVSARGDNSQIMAMATAATRVILSLIHI